jgi:hypothetical protein
MTDVYARLAYKRELPRHLTVLGKLLNRQVNAQNLLSLDETDAIRERSKSVVRRPSSRFTIRFSDKTGPRFQALIRTLQDRNPSPVLVWTLSADVCGFPRPVQLSEIDFGFEFDLEPNGVLVFITEDLCDKLLLDYFEEDGERLLEVELSGAHWGDVHY